MAQPSKVFGAELRSARESRGLSLSALCTETKLNQRHLEALEQGDYRALPGGVFRRGIVRAYLNATHLDEAEWMPRFQASYDAFLQATGAKAETDDDAWRTFALNVKKNRGRSRARTRLRWFGVFLLLVALLAGGWALYRFVLAAHIVRPPAAVSSRL